MNNLLNTQSNGTPLIIIETTAYPTWLEKQKESSQNWLSNTQFSGHGLALIPNNKGELSQALFVVKDANDFFACGDVLLLFYYDYCLNSHSNDCLD